MLQTTEHNSKETATELKRSPNATATTLKRHSEESNRIETKSKGDCSDTEAKLKRDCKDLETKEQYLIEDEKVTERNLIRLLEIVAAKSPNTRVQVRADQDVQFKYPLTVIGICKENELSYSCTVLEKQTG